MQELHPKNERPVDSALLCSLAAASHGDGGTPKRNHCPVAGCRRLVNGSVHSALSLGGKKDELMGRIQARYGYSKDKAKHEGCP